MKCPSVVILAVLLSAPSGTQAAVRHVPHQFSTIQAGIDAAVAGDTVLVRCGIYHEHDIRMKSGVCLRSETGAAGCATIDADSLGWVFYCSGVDSTSCIEGFTIKGGWEIYGGGMYCRDHSSPRLIDCSFTGNSASYGGAVYCRDYSSPSFSNCTFSDNRAACGGGVLCYYHYSSPTLHQCTFAGNPGEEGDPRYRRDYTSATRENVIIAVDATGEAVHGQVGANPGFTCCDIYNDETGDWLGCIEAGAGNPGNGAAASSACGPGEGGDASSAPSFCGTGPSSCDYGFIGADGMECYVSPVGEGDVRLPSDLYLGPVVSNPFNPMLEISYGIPAGPDSVRLAINVYDMSGERVRTLVDGVHTPGTYRLKWNRGDFRGARVPDGTYFCRMVCGGKAEIRRVELSK